MRAPAAMPKERTVQVNGLPCRVWERGQGEPLGYLAGFGGLAQWPPFLDRLAEQRRVIAPSLPGFPGALGHNLLDSQLDWLLAVHELLRQAGLEGADLIGVSVGGALAADVAACWPGFVRRLVLIGALGLADAERPMFDVFTCNAKTLPGVLCANPAAYLAQVQSPRGSADIEWQIEQTRAFEAAARILWPLGDTRLSKRLSRIAAPTLILWGERDRVVAPFYAQRFAAGIAGKTQVKLIPGAGHQADLDAPDAVAKAVLGFVGSGAAAAGAQARAVKTAPAKHKAHAGHTVKATGKANGKATVKRTPRPARAAKAGRRAKPARRAKRG
jgi:pimeloyl-ACP methyl ester carboxylesterase